MLGDRAPRFGVDSITIMPLSNNNIPSASAIGTIEAKGGMVCFSNTTFTWARVVHSS